MRKEMNPMDRFGFLKDNYNELYKLCSEAEKYCTNDAPDVSACLLKARQSIEWIIGHYGYLSDDLSSSINNFCREYLGDNVEMYAIRDCFHEIREAANNAIHQTSREWISEEECVTTVDLLAGICTYFFTNDRGGWKKYCHYYKDSSSDNNNDSAIVSSSENTGTGSLSHPLKIVGRFIKKEEIIDPLRKDEFETWEEYCSRIKSLPAMRIGYVFLDETQVDKLADIAFPAFNININPMIGYTPIDALYASDNISFERLTGFLTAKIKVQDNLLYYDYDSLIAEDSYGNKTKLTAIAWEKYSYEDVNDFLERIQKLPMLPVGVARPIKEKYDLKNQVLPFEIVPMAYVSKVFSEVVVNCSLSREIAKDVCSIKSDFIVFANIDVTLTPSNIHFYNLNDDEILYFDTQGTFERKSKKLEVKFKSLFKAASQGDVDAQFSLANYYENGIGISKDVDKALEWYKKAAEKGNADAQFTLGNYYCKRMREKEGTTTSLDLAEALYYNGDMIDDNQRMAINWYQKAALQGHAEAKDMLERLKLQF